MTKITKTISIDKKKTAVLRKMAKALNLKEWETIEREELIKVLKKSEGLPVPPESDEEPTLESAGIEEERVEIGSKAAIMKAKLSKQPKVTIMIPLEHGEKTGASQSVILNGYRLNIRKGMYVEVPRQVAGVIKDSQRQTILADDFKRMDGKPMKIEGQAPLELDS